MLLITQTWQIEGQNLLFFNSINSTMNNSSISAKKKFSILQNLMKNSKFTPTPPLVEENETINDPKQKK